MPGKREDEHGVERDVSTRLWCWYKAGDWSTDPRGWGSPIFLPRWACRIELTVASIVKEPLHEIERYERDYEREGIGSGEAFFEGWDKINPATPYRTNPVVWRIEYTAATLPTRPE